MTEEQEALQESSVNRQKETIDDNDPTNKGGHDSLLSSSEEDNSRDRHVFEIQQLSKRNEHRSGSNES
jgi:hypothetical protein